MKNQNRAKRMCLTRCTEWIMFGPITRSVMFVLLAVTNIVEAQQAATADDGAAEYDRSTWSTSFRGAISHQSDAGVNGGGEFSVNRFIVEGGIGHSPKPGRRVAVSLSYSRVSYAFSGASGFSGLAPWKDVDTLRLGLPIRYLFGQKLKLFLVPTLRFAADSDASLDDGFSGGALGGMSYRVNDRLTVGPGVGVLTRIEDDTDVFPILLINWRITERLSLETGSGLAATAGPGLTLNWHTDGKWRFFAGGRYEKLRFRLGDEGPAPGGVGEDRSLPLALGAAYRIKSETELAVVGGVELEGELRLDDAAGDRLVQENYEDAAFVALSFRTRF